MVQSKKWKAIGYECVKFADDQVNETASFLCLALMNLPFC